MNKERSPLAKLPKFKFSFLLPLYILIAALFTWLIRRGNMQLLNPMGYVASEQSKILWATIIFAAVVGVVMITAFFMVMFRYKENAGKQYEPGGHFSRGIEMAGWWSQLLVIIVISVMVWNTAHTLDPYKPISTFKKTMTVEVVALQWKWLFIYPEQRVATVNYLEIPTGTQVAFKLTADAPMNSFWVPQLSGQIYAMTGMVNQLHIETDNVGTYAGGPAEISGDEFAGMEFKVHAVTPQDFNTWVSGAQHASHALDYTEYTRLAKPSGYQPTSTYSLPYGNLFDAVVMKYMSPTMESSSTTKEGN